MFSSKNAGMQIAKLRKKLKLTQEGLAGKINVSPQAVSKWETGNAMPEVSLLVSLACILECSIDDILTPKPFKQNDINFNYEFIVSPRKPVNKFTGSKWPRSIMYGSLFTALKLFMGLETRIDYEKRQLNDDEEYILQSAFSGVCFGYSYAPKDINNECFLIYGLDYDTYKSEDYNEDQYIKLARCQIEKGYPVIVIPDEYSDTIFATGFSNEGHVLKGLGFLDGDDNKNSKISFRKLTDFPAWSHADSKMILVKSSNEKITVEQACINTVFKGLSLLKNTNQIKQPTNNTATLYGYGLAIYDIWSNLLIDENKINADNMYCLYPHAFIHYESKLRTKQFFEKSSELIQGIDKSLFSLAIKQYDEIMGFAGEIAAICHASNETDTAEMINKRKSIINMLRRSKELEITALSYLEKAMDGKV